MLSLPEGRGKPFNHFGPHPESRPVLQFAGVSGEGDISGADASLILKQIEEDRSSLFLMQPSGSEVIEEAARLLDRHPLKAYDAIQLAGCLAACYGVPPPVTFVCADVRLCHAAQLEGLSVLNPLEIS